MAGNQSTEFEEFVRKALDDQKTMLEAMVRALSGQQSQIEITNERLEELTTLLTPEEKGASGPSLGESLAALATQIAKQSTLLKDVAETFVKAIDGLPAAVGVVVRDALATDRQ